MSNTEAPSRVARAVRIPVGEQALDGDLAVPHRVRGLVVFAHGSGSSRLSSRNRFVADVLDRRSLATLLIDLLTAEEEAIDDRTRQLRFDIALLARRLIAIGEWTRGVPGIQTLCIGLFGASTGGGAALLAAAEKPELFGAIVSRGGRPDLAGSALARVTAPTLLIVGGRDDAVVELNRAAMRTIAAPVHLEIVPGATHLFEEPGALEEVANLAGDWFERHL
jgi:dienelactone hydrolase